MEAKWKCNWDFTGWEKFTRANSLSQKDWNQTLLTQINQISAQINQKVLNGGANEVSMHPIVFSIVNDFEYLNSIGNNHSISNRYKVTIDETLPMDKLYVISTYPVTKEDIIFESNMLIGEITIINHSRSVFDGNGRTRLEAIDYERERQNFAPIAPIERKQEDIDRLIELSTRLVQPTVEPVPNVVKQISIPEKKPKTLFQKIKDWFKSEDNIKIENVTNSTININTRKND